MRMSCPDETLVADAAERLGVRSAADLFGGGAPHAFVATKAITHGVVSADARMPRNWSPALAPLLEDVVRYGFTAFAREDASTTARRVLRCGRRC